MASARYTLNISEEDLKPDVVRELSKKEKRANFWHYHKWHVILAGVAIFATIYTLIAIATTIRPDYNIGLITETSLPSETIEELANTIELYGKDLNGDGEVYVQLNQYYINNQDTAMGSGFVQLQSDIQAGFSSLFIVSDPVFFHHDFGFFANINNPYKNFIEGSTDYENLSIPLLQLSAFKNTVLTDIEVNSDYVYVPKDELSGYGMCVRMFTDSNLKDNKKYEQYFADNLDLLENLK